jgi:hypothetical protein
LEQSFLIGQFQQAIEKVSLAVILNAAQRSEESQGIAIQKILRRLRLLRMTNNGLFQQPVKGRPRFSLPLDMHFNDDLD